MTAPRARVIAIHPDDSPETRVAEPPPSWLDLARAAGHEARRVDVFAPDIVEQVRGCDAFMWRHLHIPSHRAVARRLLPVLELQLGLCVFPDQRTCWHYDDKIAQAYLFPAAGIPAPRTWTFWEAATARAFLAGATYPLVMKLSGGAGSANVQLLRTPAEAAARVDLLFGSGVRSLGGESLRSPAALERRVRAVAAVARHGRMPDPGRWWELHKNYVLLQEFLPDNAFDTRITVIGARAFGFRRFNRTGDFRASGSGKIDYDQAGVAEDMVRLAFRTARALGMQSCAIDGLRRGGEAVVGEVSYTFVSRAVRDCPGHWELQGDPLTGALTWRAGHVWPEEAQMADFLARLEGRPAGAAPAPAPVAARP